VRRKDDVLNGQLFIAFMARTGRGADRQRHELSIFSFETPGPRRRGWPATRATPLGRPIRRLFHPDDCAGGRGGNPFRRRISSFNSRFSRASVSIAPALSILGAKTLDFANQTANKRAKLCEDLSQSNHWRLRHPKLESQLKPPDSPFATKSAPVTKNLSSV